MLIYLLHMHNILKAKTPFWPLHFGNSQFDPYYFQLALNSIHTVNSLTENAYMTNDLYSWHA